MPKRNRLEGRARLLEEKASRRVESVMRLLTDPNPPFHVKKSKMDQVRDYLNLLQTDRGLHDLRAVHGDEAVDAYVATMEREAAEVMPRLILSQETRDGLPVQTGPQDFEALEDDEPPRETLPWELLRG